MWDELKLFAMVLVITIGLGILALVMNGPPYIYNAVKKLFRSFHA